MTEMRARTEQVIAALSRIRDQVPSDQTVVDDASELLVSLRDELERLAAQVKWLAGKPYRSKSESVPPGQLALELLALLAGAGAPQVDVPASTADEPNEQPGEASTTNVSPKAPRTRRGRELSRRIVDNRLAESDRCCATCDRMKAELGFDKQERFVYEPAKVYILEERNYKYACQRCAEGVDTAPASEPPKPIAGSMASSSFLAFLIVSKLLDGLPIERIAKQLRRQGVDLATSTLNGWMAQAAAMFAVLYELLLNDLRTSSLISLDDTPLIAQSRGHPNGIQRGRQWIYIGDVDRVVYAEYTSDWKGTHPRSVLKDFTGDIQNDGYAGINPLFGNADGPRRVGCNDHARRKFVDALEQRDTRAAGVIDIYRALYRVEAEATAAGASAAERLALRQAKSIGLWERLDLVIGELAPRVGRKEPLGKAITYWRRQQACLRAFLDDGRFPISNAHVERQIRTVALFRKNSLFVGSVEAGQNHAVLLTMLLNCVMCGVNPYTYLVDVIDKIAGGWPRSRAAELLPRRWLEARKAPEQIDGEVDGSAAAAA